MYRFAYAEIIEESGGVAREREREVFDHCLQLLEAAEKAGPTSQAAVEAIFFTRRLWSFLIEDLGSPNNQLPDALRANLISIGLWVMRELESIRLGDSKNFQGVIDVVTSVREGLK
jgi:flagellar protein FlaF